MTVYGCEGIDVFGSDLLDENALAQGRRFTVIEVASTVAGAIELVVYRDGLHLNYISLLPEHRARG